MKTSRSNGAYKPMRGERRIAGQITTNRRAWVRLDTISVIMYRSDSGFLGTIPEGADSATDRYSKLVDEHGDDVKLFFDTLRGKASITLTSMTASELEAFMGFILGAYQRALPVVVARDDIAKEMYDDYEDDSNSRLYRALPELHVRPGEEFQYGAGIPERLDGLSPLGRRGAYSIKYVSPGPGSSMAESLTAGGSAVSGYGAAENGNTKELRPSDEGRESPF